MSTYQDYKKQIAELTALADAARQQELNQAKERIREIMSQYGLTLADITPKAETRVKRAGSPAPIKYRNDEGKTWTGRGRTPTWLEGKNKDDYLIKAA